MKTALKFRTAETPPERLADDPRFAVENDKLGRLETALATVEREIEFHTLQRELTETTTDRAGFRRQVAERRLKALAGEFERRAPDDSDLLAAAMALVAGDDLSPPVEREERTATLHRHTRVYRAAIAAQSAVLDAIRSTISAEHAEQIRPEHDRILVEVYRAAQALSRAIDSEREFRVRHVIEPGYAWCLHVNPAPDLRSALLLGSESEFRSEISRWRRFLENRGLI